MKLNELRKVIREEVRTAIQEELKDILLEAVRSPKTVVTENVAPPTKPQVDPSAQQAARQSIMSNMMATGGNSSFTSADVSTFNPQGTLPGGDLPAGNVGLDQIMGLMNSK